VDAWIRRLENISLMNSMPEAPSSIFISPFLTLSLHTYTSIRCIKHQANVAFSCISLSIPRALYNLKTTQSQTSVQVTKDSLFTNYRRYLLSGRWGS
jgi:hypothetical protein